MQCWIEGRRTGWAATLLVAVMVSGAIMLSADQVSAAPVDCLGSSCSVSDDGARIETDDLWQFLDEFEVGGRSHLFEQEFWINFDANSAANPVTPASLGNILSIVSATEDEDTNQIVIVFENSDVRVTVTYELIGAGPTMATVNYSALVENLSGSDLDLTLVDYVDYDLDDNAVGDTVRFDTDTIIQTKAGITGRARSLTSFDHFDVGECCQIELVGRLVNGHLSDDPGPSGPSDRAGAFQNNISLAEEESLLIERELQIQITLPVVSAPVLTSGGSVAVAALLAAIGLWSLGGGRRRART